LFLYVKIIPEANKLWFEEYAIWHKAKKKKKKKNECDGGVAGHVGKFN
jgi:hypothetical protein